MLCLHCYYGNKMNWSKIFFGAFAIKSYQNAPINLATSFFFPSDYLLITTKMAETIFLNFNTVALDDFFFILSHFRQNLKKKKNCGHLELNARNIYLSEKYFNKGRRKNWSPKFVISTLLQWPNEGIQQFFYKSRNNLKIYRRQKDDMKKGP